MKYLVFVICSHLNSTTPFFSSYLEELQRPSFSTLGRQPPPAPLHLPSGATAYHPISVSPNRLITPSPIKKRKKSPKSKTKCSSLLSFVTDKILKSCVIRSYGSKLHLETRHAKVTIIAKITTARTCYTAQTLPYREKSPLRWNSPLSRTAQSTEAWELSSQKILRHDRKHFSKVL